MTAQNNESTVQDPDNRTRILNVAEALFASRGYDGTSVREIVQSASVTSPMLYYYFGSKEELLLTLIKERFGSFYTRIKSYIADTDSTENVVAQWCRAMIDESLSAPGSIRFLMSAFYGPQIGDARHVLLRRVMRNRLLFVAAIANLSPGIAERRAVYAHEMMFRLLDPYLYALAEGYITDVSDDTFRAVVARSHAVLVDDLPVPGESMNLLRTYLGESNDDE